MSTVPIIPTPYFKKVYSFIDGNNIISRFNEMSKKIKDEEKEINENIVINKNFVWRRAEISFPPLPHVRFEVVRAYYYTYCDPNNEKELANNISERIFQKMFDCRLTPVIIPYIKSGREPKGDDIKICIDAIHHAINTPCDIIYLFTGDGDFVPLVEELQRMGKRVFIGAFSSGLNYKIKQKADYFFDLDNFFFQG